MEFAPFIENLMKPILKSNTFKISEMSSSSSFENMGQDRFKVQFNYCSTPISCWIKFLPFFTLLFFPSKSLLFCGMWKGLVVFDLEDKEGAPDLIVEEDFEDFELGRLKSLSSWSCTKETCLLELFEEIKKVFKADQLTKVSQQRNQTIEFQISSVSELENAEFLCKTIDNQEHVICSFPVPLDLSSLSNELGLPFFPLNL